MIERTLLLVKPDGVSRGMIGKILDTLETAGLKVVALKMVWPTKELAGDHYPWDEEWAKSLWAKTSASYKEKGITVKEDYKQMGQRIRNSLITFLTSGPIVAAVVEGNDAIASTRKMVGATAPNRADPSTIRGRYTTDSYDLSDTKGRALKNLVHASEDQKTSDREIRVWFKKNEISDYRRGDEAALY